jgi:hypothetical protein
MIVRLLRVTSYVVARGTRRFLSLCEVHVAMPQAPFTLLPVASAAEPLESNYSLPGTRSFGGGYFPKTREFWYPSWPSGKVYRYVKKDECRRAMRDEK